MLWRSLLTLVCLHTATAFMPSSPVVRSSRLLSTTEDEAAVDAVPLVVEARNIEITDALMSHVQKRIGGPLKKLSGNGEVIECDVILSVSKNPKVRLFGCVEKRTRLLVSQCFHGLVCVCFVLSLSFSLLISSS